MFHAAARWSNHIQKFAHNNLTPLSYSSLLKIAPHNTNWIVIVGDFKKMGEIALTPHHKILGFKQNYVIIQETKQFKSQQPIRIKCQAVMNQTPSTYSSKMSTDIPFYEIPGASFDQYLEDKPRVFEAIFPDKRRYQQLNEEEWRVHMLPIQFLFLTVLPVVDMRLRCKTNGKDYPSGIPPVISKVLELDIVRWQLQGLDNVVQPTHFNLGVNGALYSDRRGMKSRLKGQLEMKISVILPPVLSLVPEDVRQSVSESVLSRLVENMKDKVNGSLLADYGKFRRERQMNEVQLVESRKDGNL